MIDDDFRIEIEEDDSNRAYPMTPFFLPGLSVGARGVLATLFSYPRGWKIWVGEVQKRLGIGRDTRRKLFKELRGAGWLELKTIRDRKTGKISGTKYIVRRVQKIGHQPCADTTWSASTDRLKTPKAGKNRPSAETDRRENEAIYFNLGNSLTNISKRPLQQQPRGSGCCKSQDNVRNGAANFTTSSDAPAVSDVDVEAVTDMVARCGLTRHAAAQLVAQYGSVVCRATYEAIRENMQNGGIIKYSSSKYFKTIADAKKIEAPSQLADDILATRQTAAEQTIETAKRQQAADAAQQQELEAYMPQDPAFAARLLKREDPPRNK